MALRPLSRCIAPRSIISCSSCSSCWRVAWVESIECKEYSCMADVVRTRDSFHSTNSHMTQACMAVEK